MDQKKIDRINELARKSKAEGLTEAEKAEQTDQCHYHNKYLKIHIIPAFAVIFIGRGSHYHF